MPPLNLREKEAALLAAAVHQLGSCQEQANE